MTAEVAIINTQGVAIAADSAVTINTGNSTKVYYTQQKIFNLSEKHSVGVMVYNDAEFMEINWEIVINEFRKAIGDRVYDTLEEYAKYFLTFLRDFIHVGDNRQKFYLEIMSYWFFVGVKENYDADVSKNYQNQEITKTQQTKIFTNALKKTRERLEQDTYSTGFTDDGFVKTNKTIVFEQIEDVFPGIVVNEKTKEEALELFLLDLVKVEISRWWRFSSGIVFAGYGDKEIFPSVIDFRVFGRLGRNVVHTPFSIADVVNDSTAWINPFAQVDVINTFVRGMAPDFKDKMLEDLEGLINGITNIAGKKHAEEIQKLKSEFVENFEKYQQEEYKDPVLGMVASLPKSDLAEMAEALVSLTSLRRHMSTQEETVGGPTDVALITKTDGFVWIKKKELFRKVQENRS